MKMSKYDKIFYLGYQTPEMICFTRDSKDVKGSARLEDEITFKETMQFSIPSQDEKFIYQNAYISIYIHYPGQLIKSLDTPRFTSSFLEYRWNDILEFKLSQGTMLKKKIQFERTVPSRYGGLRFVSSGNGLQKETYSMHSSVLEKET